MARIRSNILWTFLAVTALDGMLSALLGDNSPRQAGKDLAFALVQLGLILAWVRFDSEERKVPRSTWLNVGIVCVAIVFVPLYLYRSRQPGERRSAFLGMAVFVALAIAVQASTEWLTGLLVA